MKTIKAWRPSTGEYITYRVPSTEEALAHSRATWGHQYDKVERTTVKGGLPLVWERVQ